MLKISVKYLANYQKSKKFFKKCQCCTELNNKHCRKL